MRAPSAALCENSRSAQAIATVVGLGFCSAAIWKKPSVKAGFVSDPDGTEFDPKWSLSWDATCTYESRVVRHRSIDTSGLNAATVLLFPSTSRPRGSQFAPHPSGDVQRKPRSVPRHQGCKARCGGGSPATQ